jgi:hypothetical protein
MCLCDIAKSEKKDCTIFFIDSGVEVSNRFTRVLERFDKVFWYEQGVVYEETKI